MSSLSKTYTFTPDTYAVASQVNANFDALYGWVNANAIWADASVAFTATPIGPALDPTNPDQFVRKAYADKFLKVSPITVGLQLQIQPPTSVTPSSGGFNWAFPAAFPSGCDLAAAFIQTVTDQNTLITCVNLTSTFASFRVYDADAGTLSSATITYTAFAIGH